jgi:restriction system protein
MQKKERDPDLWWFDEGLCYVEVVDGRYWAVSDDEQLAIDRSPEVLLRTRLLKFGERTDDGRLIKDTAGSWTEILKHIRLDPTFLYNFAKNPRKFEEFLAGAYRQSGWDEVTLTPSSGDRGRDVIAANTGLFATRVLDQAKAYSKHRLVRHDAVRAMLGVLYADHNVNKGLVTTTSDFEPGIESSDEFTRFMPYRLELRNRERLMTWLSTFDCSQRPTI